MMRHEYVKILKSYRDILDLRDWIHNGGTD